MKRESRALKSRSVDMAFNGAGVRDTARTLKISINTVIRALKSSRSVWSIISLWGNAFK
ncbi:hypothetical protein CE195_04630 [Sodalis-like symbiont of Philaenus spumarius]|nr:hypothetical protein CE195_04630 [Sodalis-like symbiont of Philaenus spumarius]